MVDFLSVLEHGPEGQALVVTRLYYPTYADAAVVDVGVRLTHGRLIESRRLSPAELAWYVSRCPVSLVLLWEASLPIPLVLRDYLWSFVTDGEDL